MPLPPKTADSPQMGDSVHQLVQPLHVDGVTIPANYSFAAVNEFVHADVHFEELQWSMLGMASKLSTALEKIAVYDTGLIQDIDKIQEMAKEALGYTPPAQIGFCDDCNVLIRECDKFGVEEDGGAYWCADCSGLNSVLSHPPATAQSDEI